MNDELPAIVIETGSGWLKAGFAGDDAPHCRLPSVVGRVRKTVNFMHTSDSRTTYVADEALSKRSELDLNYPIERGLVNSWEDMEKLWQHTFNVELNIDPKERPVLLTEPSLTPKFNREKTIQTMFEYFQTPAFYLADQAVMAACASGPTTALVIESGEGLTQAVPVYYGHALHHAITRLEIGGRDLTEYLQRLLLERGHAVQNGDVINDIKHTKCHVAVNYEQASQTAAEIESSYQMPDGRLITSGQSWIQCPEAMFQPSLLGLESPGIHEIVHTAIMKSHPNMQRFIYGNIVLAGGNTLIRGFSERLQFELNSCRPSGMVAKVVAPPERMYSTWIGGSIVASLSSFQQVWISKQEYEECGPVIVHRLCF